MSKQPSIVDLADLVTKWAWDGYRKKYGPLHTFFLKRIYKLQIVWSKVDTTQGEAKYDEAEKLPEKTSRAKFLSRFENECKESQNYTLKVEQIVRNTWNVAMTKCVTREGTASFTLKAPSEIVSVGASYSLKKEVTNSKEQTFEDVVTLSGECQVTASGHTHSTANSELTTYRSIRNFRMDIEFSGTIIVYLKPRLGKNRYHKQDLIINVFPKGDPRWQHNEEDKSCKTTIEGKCMFDYSLKHVINVSQTTVSSQTSVSSQTPVSYVETGK